MGERFLIDRILERGSLSVHFQPVLDLRAPQPQTHYLEALIRGPRGTIAETPTILFEYARKKNKEALVDRVCVEAILDAALQVPADVRLGINVHASSLAMDAGFIDFLGRAWRRGGSRPCA
jgi:EAL domain-containing protein (putative c-di-GMP-specific phosphodiesterase class I)